MLITIGAIIAAIEDTSGRVDNALAKLYIELRSACIKLLDVIGFLWFALESPKKAILLLKKKIIELIRGE